MSDPLANDPYRRLCAEVTCAMYEAWQNKRSTMTLRELAALFGMTDTGLLADMMRQAHGEFHDEWSWLGEPGERPR